MELKVKGGQKVIEEKEKNIQRVTTRKEKESSKEKCPLLHELEKTARVIFLEISPSYQYMALFVCQLWSGEDIRNCGA
jgi:hypothetical protein